MFKNIPEALKNISPAFQFEPFSRIIQPNIEETLKDYNKDKYRKGTILTPLITVWLVLVLAFRRDLNYTKALNWMISGTRWIFCDLPPKIIDSSAVTKARQKMGIDVFRDIFSKFVFSYESFPHDFHQYTTVIFDGAGLTMPDTDSNTEKFKKPKAKGGYGAFPQMRAVALMIMPLRLIYDIAYAAYSGKKTGERTLMFEILERIKQQDFFFLFDAGFYSFLLALHMNNHGKKFIMKLSSNVKLKQISGSHNPDGSCLALINGKIEDQRRSVNGRKRWEKVEITVRLISFQIPGFRPCRLITNLMDPEISAREIAIHYHKRWDIEIAFDEIKTHQCATLRGQSPTVLRSKCADLIEQELYAIIIVYNLIRETICKATDQEGGDPLLISFLDAMQSIIDGAPIQTHFSNILSTAVLSGNEKKARYRYLLELIANSPIDRPRRPRINPRVVKVKMSKFKRRRKGDKSENRDFEKCLQIIPRLAA